MRQCIFCHRNADSQEHIWSRWILEILPATKDGIFTQRFPNGTSKTWPTSKPELTVGKVCERNCNNGWMSTKLEGPMKAATQDIIIHNKRKALSSAECASIVAWAFKTTILSNHINLKSDDEPFFSVQQRRAFAHDLTIPKGVQVWIAKRNAGHLTARYQSTLRIMEPPPTSSPLLKNVSASMYRFQIYDCIFSIGYLLLQVTAARWAERKVANSMDFPPITQGQMFNGYAIPIWPIPPKMMDWPPASSVRDELFGTFCDRFEKFTLPWWQQ